MRGKIYAIVNDQDEVLMVSCSRLNAQEILMDLEFEMQYHFFLREVNIWGTSIEDAIFYSTTQAPQFHIKEFKMV